MWFLNVMSELHVLSHKMIVCEVLLKNIIEINLKINKS